MKTAFRIILASALVLGLGACAHTRSASPIKQFEGRTAYTQRNAWFAGGEHQTTNYRIGTMLPVNTQVTITDTSGRTIAFKDADTGQSYVIVNVEKYTRQDIAGIYDRYFNASPVNLGQFGPNTQRAIKQGKVIPGMIKSSVLVARGYPPAHATSSTESNRWKYWRGKYNTRLLYFSNDKVSRIKD